MANLRANLSRLTPPQRNAFVACFLGWTLDAFDFFILTFCLTAVAKDFQVGTKQVAEGLFWTLAMRPVGALLFGAMAERFGRKPTLMVNVVSFAIFECASAFAPTLGVFLVLRALFGIAMGGEWGVGAALTFETLPAEGRGFFSGLLQEGYVCGNLLAALVYWLVFPHLHGTGMLTNWRVMFLLGTLPALLVFFIRARVEESPAWLASRKADQIQTQSNSASRNLLWRNVGTFALLVLLMTAFTSFSHGTQDLYPTFLEKGKQFEPGTVGKIASIASIGALLGGIAFGTLSENLGRRRTIILAALLAVPMIPLWSWSHTIGLLALGGFVMQFMVQGAWGIIPAHLNELSPPSVRAIVPGLAYQLGNLLSSRNAVFQAGLATSLFSGALQPVLGYTVVFVAMGVCLMTLLCGERKGEVISPTQYTVPNSHQADQPAR